MYFQCIVKFLVWFLRFEASRVIWKMLSTKHMELRYVKAHKYERFASRRSSGSRYLPYSNVDSFLKICKILGMAGIDLFSPSDVVEKRDTRKVCMCIRSLSKKARALHLNVPDFDIVTYTVAMSTNLVGNIRRNLELSHHTFSSTASNTPHHKPRQRSRQEMVIHILKSPLKWKVFLCSNLVAQAAVVLMIFHLK
uniref:Calponin-homology (CH) domain-containing protein n=1 Tax=Salix viminalis TaxID=40686 RepID=A0A6N2K261_SALVM